MRIQIQACIGLAMAIGVATGTTIDVQLNTAPLVGETAGPFSLAFQLTDGSGTGDANNIITVNNFQFGGGAPAGSSTIFGGAGGEVTSTVSLVDSTFLSFLIQPFTPGANLSFTISTTTIADQGGTLDQFSFAILDSTGTAIPTQGGPYFDVFLAVDLNSPPNIQTFASDTTRLPAAGGPPIAMEAPSAKVVPEPSSLSFLVLGVFALLLRCWSWPESRLTEAESARSIRGRSPLRDVVRAGSGSADPDAAPSRRGC